MRSVLSTEAGADRVQGATKSVREEILQDLAGTASKGLRGVHADAGSQIRCHEQHCHHHLKAFEQMYLYLNIAYFNHEAI